MNGERQIEEAIDAAMDALWAARDAFERAEMMGEATEDGRTDFLNEMKRRLDGWHEEAGGSLCRLWA